MTLDDATIQRIRIALNRARIEIREHNADADHETPEDFQTELWDLVILLSPGIEGALGSVEAARDDLRKATNEAGLGDAIEDLARRFVNPGPTGHHAT